MNRYHDRERNVILDISSDITVLGIMLAVIQLSVYKTLGPGQILVLVSFLAAAGTWKLISPFGEGKISWWRYVTQASLLVLTAVLLSLVMVLV